MYSIYSDGVLVSSLDETKNAFYNGKLNEAVNSAGSLEFTLYRENENIPNILPMKSVIDLYENDRIIWRGRVTQVLPDEIGNEMYVCEGALAFFNDITTGAISDAGGFLLPAYDVIVGALQSYNNKCDNSKKILLGDIDSRLRAEFVETANSSIKALTDSAFLQLKKVIEQIGGMYFITFDEEKNAYLNYYAAGRVSSQTVVFQRNIVDLSRTFSVANVITAVKLFIGDDNNAMSTNYKAQNEAAINAFGYIEGVCVLKSDDTAKKKRAFVENYLKNNMLGDTTVSLTAFDLGLINTDIDKFKVGDTIKVVSDFHGIDAYMTLSKLETNLNDRASSKITLGKQLMSLTKFVTR